MCAAPKVTRPKGAPKQRWLRRAAWALWVFGVAAPGCGHGQGIAQPSRRVLEEQYVGHVFEVRHSSVIGDLYDDNERELISPYPFDEIFHQVNLQGTPMHPAHPRALVPAGTAVRITAIDHPGAASWTKRMLATPRDAIWLQLQLVPEHPDRKPFARPPLIMPIVVRGTSVPAFDTAVARHLAPEGEISRWLLGRKPDIRVAIAHKEAVVGMSREELETALGPPWRWFVDHLPDGTELQVAWYPKHELWLQDEHVVATRPSRLVLH